MVQMILLDNRPGHETFGAFSKIPDYDLWVIDQKSPLILKPKNSLAPLRLRLSHKNAQPLEQYLYNFDEVAMIQDTPLRFFA